MRTIEEVIEELNKELFSIGEQVGEEIKSGKINDTPYSRGMLQGIAMVAVCVENRGIEILEIHKAELEHIDKIRAEIKEWYWQADKQALAKDPCVVDAMVDLFIRTIDKYKAE